MQVNGIDLAGLCEEADTVVFPDPIKGRVAHIDADFLAYQVSYERVDEPPVDLADMKHNCQTAVHTLMKLAGATELHLHLTPATSNKGGRYDQALLKEYQGNRVDKPKPRYLNIIRDWMGSAFPATLHQQCEADDGMSSAQYAALKTGARNLSIIVSKDKDLSMVPGLHMDWDTGQIQDTETDFGRIWLHRGTSTKVKGLGQSFFWAQILMGDTADNISGLPKVPGSVLNRVKPTQATIKLEEIVNSPNANAKQKMAAQNKLNERPTGLCGPVLAYEILKDVKSNKEAFDLVTGMFKIIGENYGFRNWRDGEDITWAEAFKSEAQLLWMRKDRHNPNCVFNWFKEIHSGNT